MDELELVRSIQRDGNRNAFAFLVRRYQSPIRGYLRLLCHGRQEIADELAQEVFLKVFRAISSFKGESKFSTWLFQIARNAYWDARNQDKLSFEEIPPESFFSQSDLKIDLIRALQRISPQEKDVLLLNYIEGFSHEEIASMTNSPVGTVKSRLLQAKSKLSVILREGQNAI